MLARCKNDKFKNVDPASRVSLVGGALKSSLIAVVTGINNAYENYRDEVFKLFHNCAELIHKNIGICEQHQTVYVCRIVARDLLNHYKCYSCGSEDITCETTLKYKSLVVKALEFEKHYYEEIDKCLTTFEVVLRRRPYITDDWRIAYTFLRAYPSEEQHRTPKINGYYNETVHHFLMNARDPDCYSFTVCTIQPNNLGLTNLRRDMILDRSTGMLPYKNESIEYLLNPPQTPDNSDDDEVIDSDGFDYRWGPTIYFKNLEDVTSSDSDETRCESELEEDA